MGGHLCCPQLYRPAATTTTTTTTTAATPTTTTVHLIGSTVFPRPGSIDDLADSLGTIAYKQRLAPTPTPKYKDTTLPYFATTQPTLTEIFLGGGDGDGDDNDATPRGGGSRYVPATLTTTQSAIVMTGDSGSNGSNGSNGTLARALDMSFPYTVVSLERQSADEYTVQLEGVVLTSLSSSGGNCTGVVSTMLLCIETVGAHRYITVLDRLNRSRTTGSFLMITIRRRRRLHCPSQTGEGESAATNCPQASHRNQTLSPPPSPSPSSPLEYLSAPSPPLEYPSAQSPSQSLYYSALESFQAQTTTVPAPAAQSWPAPPEIDYEIVDAV